MSKTSFRLYILMRNDLPSMNPGRAMAQAAHAANQFIHEHGKYADVQSWQKDAKGFGTTICLSARKNEILRIVKMANWPQVKAGLVYDPTYKYSVDTEVASLIPFSSNTADSLFSDNGLVTLFRKELTCGYLFVDSDSTDKEVLVGALPLHP